MPYERIGAIGGFIGAADGLHVIWRSVEHFVVEIPFCGRNSESKLQQQLVGF
jgi:hypothetical protein